MEGEILAGLNAAYTTTENIKYMKKSKKKNCIVS